MRVDVSETWRGKKGRVSGGLVRSLLLLFITGAILVSQVLENGFHPNKTASTTFGSNQKVAPPPPDKCSPASLYENPLQFGKCIRRDPSPSCHPRQTQNWDGWVGARYRKYGGQCITPQLLEQTGETWAISGRGSTLEATQQVRTLLERLFQDPFKIQTFLDCPCGDWLWMQTVNLTSVKYFGGDITQQTVDVNTKCFARDNVHFHTLDWSCAIPPPVDLVMLRDVLFHLSTSVVLDILRHVNQSGAKYLLSTTFPNNTAKVDNYVADAIGYRNINLYGPPFNFPEPIMKTGVEAKGGRHMAVWKLPIPVV